MKNKKKLNLILSIFILAVFVATAASMGIVAYAVWVENIDPVESVPVPSSDFNASAKHILFVALDPFGNMIAKGDNVSEFASFGAVGYTGILPELEIPAEFTISGDTAQGIWGIDSYTRNVTFVGGLDDNDIGNYKVFMDGAYYTVNDSAPFANNHIVTELKIGANVNKIAEGTFTNMEFLTSLYIKGLGTIEIGDYAFMGCNKLSSLNVYKTKYIIGNLDLIFYGMPIPVLQ